RQGLRTMQKTGAFPRRTGGGMALAVLLSSSVLSALPAAHAATPYWKTNSIAFSGAQYSVTQTQGSVTVLVRRSGDASQAASVAFWSANGTAVAGRDYTAVSGRLSWRAGD